MFPLWHTYICPMFRAQCRACGMEKGRNITAMARSTLENSPTMYVKARGAWFIAMETCTRAAGRVIIEMAPAAAHTQAGQSSMALS